MRSLKGIPTLWMAMIWAGVSCTLFQAQAQEMSLGFNPLWSRNGQAVLLSGNLSAFITGSTNVLALENRGPEDWALETTSNLLPQPGEVWEFSVTVDFQGAGGVAAAFAWRDAQASVLDWTAGEQRNETPGRYELRARWLVTETNQTLTPRIIGWGEQEVRLESPRLHCLRTLPPECFEGREIAREWPADTGRLRMGAGGDPWGIRANFGGTNVSWQGGTPEGLTFLGSPSGQPVYYHAESDTVVDLLVQGHPDRPEWTLEWRPRSDGSWQTPVAASPRWQTAPGNRLILPLNQGVDVPVDHPNFPALHLSGAGGHGMSLPFWSIAGGGAQLVSCIERHEDAALVTDRANGLLQGQTLWRPSMGQWNGARTLHWILLDGDTVNHLAQWYRGRLAEEGRSPRTWAEKFQTVPAARWLIGAANVYIESSPVEAAQDVVEWGWDRVLWSHDQGWNVERAFIEERQAAGWLVGRYDICQDVMNPALDPNKLPHMNAAWPDDLILDPQGEPSPGWVVRYPDGREVACGILDDRRAVAYAEPRIREELSRLPFLARFMDTTTATDLRENYRPGQAMDRSTSLHARQDLLNLLSGTLGLVTGSETGADWAADGVHYYEGMNSLVPFRDPLAGYTMGEVIDPPPPEAAFNVDPAIRIPLWELIYRDSVVSYWYWGDGNNKMPAHWEAKDRFNVLYATPPLYYVRSADWQQRRAQFRESYARIRPATRAADVAAMTGFHYLSSDRRVQQTRFANGARITMNFSDQPWTSPDGHRLEAGDEWIQPASSDSASPFVYSRIVAPAASEIHALSDDGQVEWSTSAATGPWRLETTDSLADAVWRVADFGAVTAAHMSAEIRLPWRPLNTAQTLREDMSLCGEAIPHGVPWYFEWRDCPRLSYGNNPQHLTAMIPWGQLYETEAGNTATNTRVHIRDLQACYLSKSDGQWHAWTGSRDVEGAYFAEDFTNNAAIPAADFRHEPDGGISVRLIPGYNFHFWSTAGRVLIDTNDIAAAWASCEARLILHDPAAPDDRAAAQYILSTGSDYWLDLAAQWDPSWLNNGDIGIGRFKFVRPQWRAFNMHSMSEDQLNNQPPPLQRECSTRYYPDSPLRFVTTSKDRRLEWN